MNEDLLIFKLCFMILIYFINVCLQHFVSMLIIENGIYANCSDVLFSTEFIF